MGKRGRSKNLVDKLVFMIFGSQLYGTNTPESDTDYKGVFMPPYKEILLNRIPKSININTKKGGQTKNTSEDTDTEVYSLHYFIKLACEGQTVALDMLHAPENMILETSEIWKEIVKNRKLFYTKNLSAFVGYARRQASKYSLKGSRLDAAKKVIDVLNKHDNADKLKSFWDELPVGEHCHMLGLNMNNVKEYQVCGKIIQETVTVEYARNIFQKFYDNYGARAKLARENKNIDWKAVSHALRAAYQTKQLLIEDTITFPLKEAEFLREVKSGKLDFIHVIQPELEFLMEEIEVLSKISTLPDKVDRNLWDQFMIYAIEDYYNLKGQ